MKSSIVSKAADSSSRVRPVLLSVHCFSEMVVDHQWGRFSGMKLCVGRLENIEHGVMRQVFVKASLMTRSVSFETKERL